LYLEPGLLVVFVGFNPGLTSGRTGHYYAHPSNRFWHLLAAAGLTARRYGPEEDYLLPQLGYGFTDLVRRMSRTSQELKGGELTDGAREVRKQLRTFRPAIAAFTGKGVAAAVTGRPCGYGWLDEEVEAGVRGLVLTSPSGLAAQSSARRLAPYLELSEAVLALRSGRLPTGWRPIAEARSRC
jgi:TDG/mug DNA glycosylase family protein